MWCGQPRPSASEKLTSACCGTLPVQASPLCLAQASNNNTAMAWVHRTTRDNNKVGLYGSTTPSHVGPGSYKPRSAFDKKGPSFAPFASTADRSGGVLAEVTAHSTPGPGAYRVEGSNPKQIAHNASTTPFLSFQERFKRPANFDTPGPGAYKVPAHRHAHTYCAQAS